MRVPLPFFRDYLAELARHQWLIASATSEIGVGGDLRRSLCAVERDGARIRVIKQAPVISYGEEADDILLTARRAPDAAPSDQVLVLVRNADVRLTRTGDWDTLGMRGTRSLGFTLDAVAPEQIVPVPFADIASQTMLPVSHVLWTSLWLGLAERRGSPGARVRSRRGAAHTGDVATERAAARRDRRRARHDGGNGPRRPGRLRAPSGRSGGARRALASRSA